MNKAFPIILFGSIAFGFVALITVTIIEAIIEKCSEKREEMRIFKSRMRNQMAMEMEENYRINDSNIPNIKNLI